MEQREIKFRYRYTDGTNWIMQVFTLEQIINGDPFEVLSDSPLLKEYKMVGRDEWSGFLDMAGNEIYEHDIMCHPEFSQVDDFPVVLFRNRPLTPHLLTNQ